MVLNILSGSVFWFSIADGRFLGLPAGFSTPGGQTKKL
jgi:hypothetical protein